MVTYVDDFLTAAGDGMMRALLGKIRETWVCSEPEFAEKGKTMRYCGYDIEKLEKGYALRQTNYVRDLLRRRGVKGTEMVPMMKAEEGEDEVGAPIEATRAAQAITGELSWLAQRTRPDIGFAVSFMSRMIHKRPTYVCRIGDHVLAYLNGTTSHGLIYSGEGDREVLEIYADSSYGPSHENYKSIQGAAAGHQGSMLQWESTKQPFVAQSTAEAELLAYNEAYQMGEAMSSLLEVLHFKMGKRLHGDSKAALALCLNESGHWRTRHLRLRATKLREALQVEKTWEAVHQEGGDLVADGLTKPSKEPHF